MNVDRKDYIGLATALLGAGVTLIPLSDFWRWLLASGLIALGLIIIFGPRVWSPWGATKIPMKEAATRAYEKTQNTIISEAAERDGTDLLTWYCWALWQRLPVFGARTPSRVVEQIPWADRNLYNFKIEGEKIVLIANSGDRRFDNLHVRRADLNKGIGQLRSDILGNDALFW